jgi:predicted nucleic acid-binding protein
VGILIDSSVLIAHERLAGQVDALVAARPGEEFFISAITASELLHGVQRAVNARIRAKRSAFVESVIANFPLLPIDAAVARIHAQLWAELAAAGSLIGAHDLWIAATAVAHDLTLVTLDTRDFKRVDALELEDWSQE